MCQTSYVFSCFFILSLTVGSEAQMSIQTSVPLLPTVKLMAHEKKIVQINIHRPHTILPTVHVTKIVGLIEVCVLPSLYRSVFDAHFHLPNLTIVSTHAPILRTTNNESIIIQKKNVEALSNEKTIVRMLTPIIELINRRSLLSSIIMPTPQKKNKIDPVKNLYHTLPS